MKLPAALCRCCRVSARWSASAPAALRVLALTGLAALFACGLCTPTLAGSLALSAASPLPSPVVSEPRAVQARDGRARLVRLVEPAARIITLAPHATELVFAVGAGATLAGTTDYSDFPAAARAVPRIGAFNTLALERIVALRPDLVLAWSGGNPPALLDRLRAGGIAVFESDPKHLPDIARDLRALGTLTGHPGEGERAAVGFEGTLEALRVSHLGRVPVRVFHQVWGAPLMTVGEHHVVAAVIRLCGGVPVPQGPDRAAWVVSIESVLAADPQLIVSTASPLAPAGAGDEGASQVANTMAPDRPPGWQRYPWLSAVARGQLRTLAPDLIHRPGPRLVEGAQAMCELIDAAREAPVAARAKVRNHGL